MDYFKTAYFQFFSISVLLLSLSACDADDVVLPYEIELPDKPLEILGQPHTSLYYGTNFRFTFGATGGDGTYSYKYIKNPNISEENGANIVDLEITVNHDASQDSFDLHGIPALPIGTDLANAPTGTFYYGIEITDGVNTEVQEYEFTLNPNGINLSTSIDTLHEARSNLTDYNSLLSSRSNGQQIVCETIENSSYASETNRDGYDVLPNTFQIFFDAPVTSETTVYYHFLSDYDEDYSEDDLRNAGKARPGVDFLDEERSVTFLPGERYCDAHLDLLDDTKIEDREHLSVEVYDSKGGGIKLDGSGAIGRLEIRDNELEPSILSETVTKNKGETVIIPIKLPSASNYPLAISFSIDSEETTLAESEYELFPESGIVILSAGEVESSLVVTLKQTDTNSSPQEDKLLVIKSNIDNLIDRESTKISVNQWPLRGDISNEIVESEGTALGMTIEEGVITILVEDSIESPPGSSSFIKSFNIDGNPFDFENGTNEYHFQNAGVELTPVALASGNNSLVVVFQTDGIYGEVHRGKVDFVVSVLSRNNLDATYQHVVTKQYGTEGDDFVSGVQLIGDKIYVYGKTDGLEFDGRGGPETNNGKTDGFLYQLDVESATSTWDYPRFIGTPEADEIVDLDAGLVELAILVKKEINDVDGFVHKISEDSGADIEDIEDALINSIRDDIPVMISYQEDETDVFSLFKSKSLLPTNDLTSTASSDIHVLRIDDENLVSQAVILSTSAEDLPLGLLPLSEADKDSTDNRVLIYGNTFGEFEDNTKNSINSSDGFVAVLNGNVISQISQFGTIGDNKIISVEEVSAYKTMVLWSENFTSDDNTLRYRVSAFSSNGKKLSFDPVIPSPDTTP